MVFTGRDEDVTVRVGGDASGLNNALGGAIQKLGSFKGKVALAGAALGALAVGGLAAATSAAADFEEAMVEVEKVTDPETAAAMSDRIREMSQEMPVAQEELAGIAAQAGRFGVEGEESMEQFTESVAKMAVATDLSTQEAGEAFARMTTLMDEEISNVENVGSAVNELSNNMATSASEITNASTRSAGALNQLGLQTEEILALNASMNEVSASSRIAGTRLRRFAQEIQDPGKTEDLAAALGMSVDEFERMREESPNELMQLMVERFQAGGESADALRETLSTTSRQALAGLAENTESWTDAQEIALGQLEEGTSLQEEYDAAADTFNSRLQVLQNQLREVAIQIGNRLLPPLTDLLRETMDFVGLLSDRLGPILDRISGTFSGDMNPALTEFGAEARETGQALIDIWNRIDGVVVPVVSGLAKIIKGGIIMNIRQMKEAMELVMNLVQGDFGGAMQNLKNILSAAIDQGINILSVIKDGLKAAMAWMKENGPGLFLDALTIMFIKVPDAIKDSAVAGIKGFLTWLTEEAPGQLADAITNLANAIKDKIKNAVIDAVTLGMRASAEEREQLASALERETGSRSFGGFSFGPEDAQTGGLIERGGILNVHAGERVVPSAQVTDRGEVEAGGGLSARELESALVSALNSARISLRTDEEGLTRFVRDEAEIVVDRSEGRRNRRFDRRGTPS